MVDKVIQPQAQRPITDSGRQTPEMRTWMRKVSERSVIVGDGSPEGVVAANPGAQYMDSSGVTGSILYVKKSGSGATGWILV